MTILVDWQIKEAIKSGEIGIRPYDEKLINPNSIDVRLGDHFVWYQDDAVEIDPLKSYSLNYKIKECHNDYIFLHQNQFRLGRTKEVISLPDNIVATLEGKSSLARIGLQIHQTGGFIDAGFRGSITLELFNCNNRIIKLTDNMRIAQIVFYKTEKAEIPYNKKRDSKYNGQVDATLSRYSN